MAAVPLISYETSQKWAAFFKAAAFQTKVVKLATEISGLYGMRTSCQEMKACKLAGSHQTHFCQGAVSNIRLCTECDWSA